MIWLYLTVFCENHKAGFLQVLLLYIAELGHVRGLGVLSSSGMRHMWAHMHACMHTHRNRSQKHSKTCYLDSTFWRWNSSRLKDETVLLPCPVPSEEEEEKRWEWRIRAGAEAGRGEGEVGKRGRTRWWFSVSIQNIYVFTAKKIQASLRVQSEMYIANICIKCFFVSLYNLNTWLT